MMVERANADLWLDMLPIMDVDGSLATVQTSSEAGQVFAKTGTLAAFDAFNTRFAS